MIISIDEFLKMNIKDKVFIIETDTVYGIGCLYQSKKAVLRINEIKNRASGKFYSLLVSNYKQVEDLTLNSADAKELMDEYWPGALTIIFNKSSKVEDYITSNNTVGLRMPNSVNALKALEKFGPMVMTSLNKSGEAPLVKFEDCLKFEDEVDFIIKGKDLSGKPSTVYDFTNNKILRNGDIVIKI